MRLEQEKLRNLLTDTIVLLCNNGLSYKKEMKIEGLIGVTVDSDEVFLVHLNEVKRNKENDSRGVVHSTTTADQDRRTMSSDSESSCSTKRRKRKRPTKKVSKQSGSGGKQCTVTVKKEKADDNELGRMGEESHDLEPLPCHSGDADAADLGCIIASSESLASMGMASQSSWFDNEMFDAAGRMQLLPECNNWTQQPLAAPTFDQMKMPQEFAYTPPARRPRFGAKPFPCHVPGCKKSFYYKHHMKRHIRINHPDHVKQRQFPMLSESLSPPVYSSLTSCEGPVFPGESFLQDTVDSDKDDNPDNNEPSVKTKDSESENSNTTKEIPEEVRSINSEEKEGSNNCKDTIKMEQDLSDQKTRENTISDQEEEAMT